jgi:hypothetical protein
MSLLKSNFYIKVFQSKFLLDIMMLKNDWAAFLKILGIIFGHSVFWVAVKVENLGNLNLKIESKKIIIHSCRFVL